MSNRRYFLLILSLVLLLFACNFLEESISEEDPTATDIPDTQLVEDTTVVPPTSGPASPQPIPPTTQPNPQPAALRIVYTDGGNIWLSEGNSSPLQITNSGFAESLRISHDGLKIAFTRRTDPNGLAELRAVDADGNNETTLLTVDDMKSLYPSTLGSKGFEIGQMEFLPGSHLLYFNTYEAFETVGLAMTDDLLRINTNTGDLSKILTPGNGGNFEISPDGNRIVIVRPDAIDMIGPGGGQLAANVVTYLPVVTYSEFYYYAQPVWSKNSGGVGIAIPSDDPLGPNPNGSIWKLDNTGSSSTNVSTIPGDFYFSQVFSSSVMSPTLNRVAFLRDTATPNIRDLILANPDGTGESTYATGDIGWVGWAPDGVHFVYSEGGPMDLQLGTDGAAAIPLVTGMDLSWINANRYLYLAGSMGSWTLMRGELGLAPAALASPSGDFISYDFNR
jgi:hypothetical protein